MKPQLKYGLIGGLIHGLILMLSLLMAPDISELEDMSMGANGLWKVVQIVIPIVAIVLATREIKEQLGGGGFSFGKAFKVGYGTGLYFILTYTVMMLLMFYVIFPDWYPLDYDQFIDRSGQDPDELPEAFSKWMTFMFDHMSLIATLGWVFMNLIAFAVVSLITGAIFSRERNPAQTS